MFVNLNEENETKNNKINSLYSITGFSATYHKKLFHPILNSIQANFFDLSKNTKECNNYGIFSYKLDSNHFIEGSLCINENENPNGSIDAIGIHFFNTKNYGFALKFNKEIFNWIQSFNSSENELRLIESVFLSESKTFSSSIFKKGLTTYKNNDKYLGLLI